MIEKLEKAQPRVLQLLRNSVKEDRVCHAYLFIGDKGAYKKEMAYHLAMMLYCGENPCYSCDNCKHILSNNHMNVHYIAPIGQGIKKEQIVSLQEEFSKKSLIDGPRIYIVDDADSMNTQAANSLLKFIEDPIGEETYGILLAQNAEDILPTIRSRCIIINFDNVNKELLKSDLCESGIDPSISSVLACLSGNKEDALELLETKEFNDAYQAFLSFTSIILNEKSFVPFYRDNEKLLSDEKKALKKNEKVLMLLRLIEILYRDTMEYMVKGNSIQLLEFKDTISALASQNTLEFLTEKLNYILDLESKIPYSINVSLAFTLLLYDLNGGEF